MTSSAQGEPLVGDPARQASASIRGYLYQIWISVHAWLEIGQDELLYLEGAEDIDRLYSGGAEAVQVKDKEACITLRSDDIAKAITSYWTLRADNPGKAIRFRFLTTATATIERGAPFGKNVKGLDVWEKARRDKNCRVQLIGFLKNFKKLPENLRKFIKETDPSEVQRCLFDPIVWELGAKDASCVEAEIERKLVGLGETFRTLPDYSKAAVAPLLKAAFTNASSNPRKPLTRQDMLEIFEEVTTERVPRHELVSLRMQFQQQLTASMSGLASGDAVSVHIASRVQQKIPALPAVLHERKPFVDSCCLDLISTGFIVLTGSVGMGKTTLAKLIAARGGQWVWVHLAGMAPEAVLEVLHLIGRLLDIYSVVSNLLIDDIDLTPSACRLFEQTLGGIIVTAKSRSGQVIVTSQRTPSGRLQSALSMSSKSIVRVPYFTDEEISVLLRAKSFSRSDQDCLRLAKIIRFQTSGHPLLVQAAIQAQLASGWPVIKFETILETPPSVAQEKREARQILIDVLSDDQKKLTYWLGIAGMFRRDHAIAIGAKAKIPSPGDQIDALLGPWVEPIGDNYFRVSPLIGSAANDAFDQKELQNVHALLAEAFLNCNPKSQWEANAIMMHAFAGKQAKILYLATQMAMQSDPVTSDILLKELSWMLALTTKKGCPIFPEDPQVNAVLRMLQFRIAVAVDTSKAEGIAESWDREIALCDERKFYNLQRFMYVLHLLMYYQAPIRPARLIDCFKEFAALREASPEFAQQMNMKRFSTGDKSIAIDTYAVFFTFVASRCDGPKFLMELVYGMEQLPEELRERMVSSSTGPMSPSTFLVNRAWIAVSECKSPDWPACIAALESVRTKAAAMRLKGISHAAARAIAVVYDEYLDNPVAAEQALDKAESELGSSSILNDQRANILYRKKDYDSALKILQPLLAGVDCVDDDPDITLWTIRKAACAAAMTGKWALAADLFSQGVERSRTIEVDWIPIGLIADAGFAHWKAGQYPQMLAALTRALTMLEKIQDKDSFTTFALGKTIGCILVWVENQFRNRLNPNAHEPYPGMCSDTEKNERLRDLPVTLVEYCWVILADIEFNLDIGDAVYQQVSSRFDQSKRAISLFLLRQIQLSYAIKHHDYYEAISRSLLLVRTITTLRSKGADGNPMEARIESSDLKAPVNQEESAFVLVTISALMVFALIHGELSKLLDAWGGLIAEDYRVEPLQSRFGSAQELLQSDLVTARTRMRVRDAGWFVQTLAALRLTFDANTTPEDMFQAHIFLLGSLRNTTVERYAATSLATLIEQNWRHLIKYPVLLRTPMTNVPTIRAACDSHAQDVTKLAVILLTAIPAIGIPVPRETIRDLEQLRDAGHF